LFGISDNSVKNSDTSSQEGESSSLQFFLSPSLARQLQGRKKMQQEFSKPVMYIAIYIVMIIKLSRQAGLPDFFGTLKQNGINMSDGPQNMCTKRPLNTLNGLKIRNVHKMY
jgi:hypothetical protein